MKTRGTTLLMCFLGGGIGLHRFYLGQTGLGLVYLLSCWTFIPACIAFCELLYFLFMSDAQFDSQYNQLALAYQQPAHQLPMQQVHIHTNGHGGYPGAPGGGGGQDLSTQLHQLHDLHVKGILSAQEFEAQKRRILGG
jgi:TM2 domain-containing membrane protein YozV